MKYDITATTSTGNYRSHNEDAVLLGEHVITDGSHTAAITPPFLCAVCDGVGGENAGEIASKLTAELLSASIYKNTAELKNRIFEIHDELIKYSRRKPDAVNMQTTLCLVSFDSDDMPCCLNIGDSRAYLIKNGGIRQITTDQSLAQYLTETGRAEKFDIDIKSYKNVIISSIGNPKQYPMVDLFSLGNKLSGDDMVIICSDGISDYLKEEKIYEIMSKTDDMENLQKALIDEALKSGSRDNLSVVTIALSDRKD